MQCCGDRHSGQTGAFQSGLRRRHCPCRVERGISSSLSASRWELTLLQATTKRCHGLRQRSSSRCLQWETVGCWGFVLGNFLGPLPRVSSPVSQLHHVFHLRTPGVSCVWGLLPMLLRELHDAHVHLKSLRNTKGHFHILFSPKFPQVL